MQLERSPHNNEDPAHPKIKIEINKYYFKFFKYLKILNIIVLNFIFKNI